MRREAATAPPLAADSRRERSINQHFFPDTAPSTDGHRDPQLLDPQVAFHELSQILLGSPLAEVLDRVAHLARRTIPGADEVSVTLLEGDTARSVAFTGDLAIHLDERQYEKGFGPCMDAARSGVSIEIVDTSYEQTYPDFARQAQRAGVTNTLSVGLPIPQGTVGAINIYGKQGAGFDGDSHALAVTFASYSAVALANAALYNSTSELARQMEAAMTSRAVIEQAKGMVMARRGVSADEAFSLLIRISQATNRKLRDIAFDVVEQWGKGH